MSMIALKERVQGWMEGNGPSGFGYHSTAEDVTEGLDLSDRTILITGCNSGLGRETMQVLAARGATVLGAARTHEKAEKVCTSIEGNAFPFVCELSDLESVHDCAEQVASRHAPLDGIVCNAGIMALPELEHVHGYEKQFFINHIGHFALVTSLREALSEHGRVVMLSSEAHRNAPDEGIDFDNLSGEQGYDPWEAYGQSKLACMLVARRLAERFEQSSTNRTAYAVHPGVINTNLTRHLGSMVETAMGILEPLIFKSIPQGAATQTYAVAHPEAPQYSGEYLTDCNVAESIEAGRDSSLAERLWEESEAIVEELTSETESHSPEPEPVA